MIISDTHNLILGDDDERAKSFHLPHVDVLLHWDDLTNRSGPNSYEQVLAMLGALRAELKLVIHRNNAVDVDKHGIR